MYFPVELHTSYDPSPFALNAPANPSDPIGSAAATAAELQRAKLLMVRSALARATHVYSRTYIETTSIETITSIGASLSVSHVLHNAAEKNFG